MSDDPFGFCAEPKCEDTPELPPIKKQVYDFIGTARDVIVGVLTGDGVRVTKQVANQRFNICYGCEYLIKETNRCSQCGCFMKTKVKFKKAYCPVHKWDAVDG